MVKGHHSQLTNYFEIHEWGFHINRSGRNLELILIKREEAEELPSIEDIDAPSKVTPPTPL